MITSLHPLYFLLLCFLLTSCRVRRPLTSAEREREDARTASRWLNLKID